jgi:AraC family transcriptional regulator, positive regulator of tynA and feaB
MTTATWSTQDVDAAHQFDYWREVVCSAFVRLSPERTDTASPNFRGTITSQPLGAVGLSKIAAHPQVVHRRCADIAAVGKPIVYLNIQISGSSDVTQLGHDVHLEPGSITMLDASVPFAMRFDKPFRQWSLHLDAERLAARCGDVHHLCGKELNTSPVLAGLLQDSLRSVWRQRDVIDDTAAEQVGDHLAHLVFSTVDANRGTTSGRDTLLRRGLALIEARIGDHRLSPAMLAGELGVSIRLLHQLFTAHSMTAGESITDARLRAVSDRLRSDRFAHQSIARIAAECGVGDLSHFSRAFRSRHGVSPGQFRMGQND